MPAAMDTFIVIGYNNNNGTYILIRNMGEDGIGRGIFNNPNNQLVPMSLCTPNKIAPRTF